VIAAEVETSAFQEWPNTGLISQEPLEQWCREMLGPKAEFRDQVSDEYPWTFSWRAGRTVWHFAREESATMFRLRWCNGN